jgi:hypothetical protein
MAAEDPEALDLLRAAVKQGRVEVGGASYGQPYALFHHGESAVRQLTYGVRSVIRLLGVRPKSFWEEECQEKIKGFFHDPFDARRNHILVCEQDGEPAVSARLIVSAGDASIFFGGTPAPQTSGSAGRDGNGPQIRLS